MLDLRFMEVEEQTIKTRLLRRFASRNDVVFLAGIRSGSEGVPTELARIPATVNLRSGKALTRTGVIS